MSVEFFKRRCCCNLNLSHFSHIVGWLGIVLRLVATILLLELLVQLSDSDSQFYKTSYGVLLAYILVSFVPNACFIYGIIKVLRNFMLAYIIVLAVELSLGVLLLIGASVLLIALGSATFGIVVAISSLLFIGANYSLWLCSVIFYKQMKIKPEIAEEEVFDEPSVHLTRFYFPDSTPVA